MSRKYPYSFIAYTKSGTAYTKAGSGFCSLDLLGASRVKGLVGNLTSADSMLCCSPADGALFKKDGRVVVNKAGSFVALDIIYPDNIRGHHYEVYGKYNGTVKINEATGELV